MKIRYPNRSALPLIRFPAILTLFAVLAVAGSSNIASVTDGINIQLFNSARLEEASRSQTEFHSLFSKAYRFTQGDARVSRADVQLALDIFWSRIDVLRSVSYRETLDDVGGSNAGVISEIGLALPDLERAVASLQFGNKESFDQMGVFLARFQDGVARYGDKAYAERRNQMRKMVEKEMESLANLNILQLEFAALVCLMFLYVFIELYLSRRGNRRLNLAIQDKQHLLISDHLTGIGNRRHFEASLQASKAGTDFSIVLLDLDGFKAINDTLGHAAGDCLLIHVARVLQSLGGRSDVVCRLGGDEFAVLLDGSKPRADLFARQILDRLAEPVEFEGSMMRVAASIGVVHSSDGCAATSNELMMRNADAALYVAKESGRNRIQFTTSEIARAADRKRQLQTDLKAAISEGGICIEYQPIVSLVDERPRALEALVRWSHPQYGAVSPPEIIEAAEKTSQILPLTLHIVDKACELRNRMNDCGHDLQVAVNVSPRLMAMPGFAEAVGSLVDKHDLEQGKLMLEITEDAMMVDNETVDHNIEMVRAQGILLAVDDFGKGYSNLGRLANLEFRKIKLDKSIIDGVADSRRSLDIVGGIHRMATDLGISVIAEGVESHEQKEKLRELGMVLAQGFHFARPMNPLLLLGYLEATAGMEGDVSPARRVAG